jgi:SAM-dependent methyltransferase
MSAATRSCRVCGAVGSFKEYSVREMMFGSREPFEYFQCDACHCLQIAEIPTDLQRHYPRNYYSFGSGGQNQAPTAARRWLQKQRARTAIFGRGFRINAVAKRIVPLPSALHSRHGGLTTGEVLKKSGIATFSARFLDVGCGAFSAWLHHLWSLGFDNLIGVDPYIDRDHSHDSVRILRRQLAEVEGHFDLITFHHSLEHMEDQSGALAAAKGILAPGGTVLVRVPLVSSLAWERYGVNWVELDAPRHLYLHSIESLKHAAREVGLDLVEIAHDSVPLEFFGSELYARDIPLTDPRSPWVDENSRYFSVDEMAEFSALARRVNEDGRGGRAGFYFRATR